MARSRPTRQLARAGQRLATLALAVALALAGVAAAVPLAGPAAAAGSDPPPYVPPVDAPVLARFDPPEHRWGAGTRGLKYRTEPGAAVHASGAGEVTFAGPVAGSLHVTVLHADGVRTSYSFLGDVGVRIGQRVEQGDRIGTAGELLHLGARLGDAYFDPESLFGGQATEVRLVPFADPPGRGLGGERSAINQLAGRAWRLVGSGGAAARELAGVVAGGIGQSVALATHYGPRVSPVVATIRVGMRSAGAAVDALHASRRPCTGGGEVPEPPGERRLAVLVGGLGSSSQDAAIDQLDTASIGYAAGDVVRFSYAGGRVPDGNDDRALGAPRAYDAHDSQQDLRRSGERLADLVEQAAAVAPVDLLAHSQGGVVARLALDELERRHGGAWLRARVGALVTLGTPHGGANAATAVAAARATPFGAGALGAASQALPAGIDPSSPAVAQLAETSDLVAELRALPAPSGVAVTTIAARGDLVVPVPRTRAPGATHVTVGLSGPRAHDALPASEAARREVALAVAGMPPGCTSFASALADRVTGEAISHAQDLLGAGAWLAGERLSTPFNLPASG